MSSTRAALEVALAAEPDNFACHAAYADLLIEEGDPRGEYVQLQLAIEDRDQPAERLRAMEQQAHALRQRHEAEWLGPLAQFVNPPRGPSVGAMVAENVAVTFRRGWVHRIEVGRLTDDICYAIARAPMARLLAELVIETNQRLEPARQRGHAVPSYVGLELLAQSPNARALRQLELGIEEAWQLAQFDSDIGRLVAATSRLEHLKIVADRFSPARVFKVALPHLQSLYVTTNNNRLPIAVLGMNESLGNLARLHLDLMQFASGDGSELENERDPVYPDELQTFFRSPHLTVLKYLALRLPGFGDVGVEELIASGLINRLRGLDLCRCRITDEGALALAECEAVGRLEYLHLDNNYLSEAGIDALASAGVQVSRQQFFADDWEGDIPF